MKNMFENKSDEYVLEAVNKAVDAFTGSILSNDISRNKSVIPVNDINDTAIVSIATISDGLDKIMSKARANTVTDIITRTIGLFDSDMTELGAKRSELLRKDNVKNYTYKHHIWKAAFFTIEFRNLVTMINNVLYCTRIVVDKRSRNCSAQAAKEWADEAYKNVIDGYIETKICGWAKGAYEKDLRVWMIGDGKKEVIKQFNFQDDWSISDMLKWESEVRKEILDEDKEYQEASVKDFNEQIKKIVKEFNTIAKADKANAKIYANEIKRCIKYTNLFLDKMGEFNKATYYCLNLQREEIHKVLKGLLEYNGD